MNPRIGLLEPGDLDAVARFSRRTWTRPSDPEFLTWRYLASRPFQRTWLAWFMDECVGILSAFRRTGVVDGSRFPLLAIVDWFCLPEIIGQGIGGALLRTVMDEAIPILAFGGTAYTQTRLPKMGWRMIAEGGDHLLPLDGSILARSAARRLRIPERWVHRPADLACRLWIGNGIDARAKRSGVDLVEISTDRVGEPYEGIAREGLSILPEPAMIGWMRAGPAGLGQYEAMAQIADGRVRGWILTRRHTVAEETWGDIVDIFPPAGPGDRRSLVASAVAYLASCGVHRIRAQATAPDLEQELRHNRFVRRNRLPVFWWSPAGDLPSGPIHLTAGCDDGAILPYPGPRIA